LRTTLNILIFISFFWLSAWFLPIILIIIGFLIYDRFYEAFL